MSTDSTGTEPGFSPARWLEGTLALQQRLAGIRALGDGQHSDALWQLLPLLGDQAESVRRAAADALIRLRGGPVPSGNDMPYVYVLDGALKAAAKVHDGTLNELGELLSWPSDQSPVGYRAVRCLVPPQTEADLPRLVKLASHNDWQVAYLGAELLGDVGSAAIPALKLAMGTGNWIQRAIVARSLERIGDPAAAPILRERLKEMENGTRAAIYSALAAICDSADYEAMRLGLFDRCTAVQAACARGLTRLAQREPSLQMRQTLPRLRSISAPWRLEESGEKQAARGAIAAIELATRSDSTLPIPARPSSDENLPIPSGPASRCTDNLAIPQ